MVFIDFAVQLSFCLCESIILHFQPHCNCELWQLWLHLQEELGLLVEEEEAFLLGEYLMASRRFSSMKKISMKRSLQSQKKKKNGLTINITARLLLVSGIARSASIGLTYAKVAVQTLPVHSS
jgi:hypothetical protein